MTGGAAAHRPAHGRDVLGQVGGVVIRDVHGGAARQHDHLERLDDEIGEVLAPDDLTRPSGADVDDAEVCAAGIRHDDRVLVAAECVARPERDPPRLPAGGRNAPGDERRAGDLEHVDPIECRVGQVELATIGVVNGVGDTPRSLERNGDAVDHDHRVDQAGRRHAGTGGTLAHASATHGRDGQERRGVRVRAVACGRRVTGVASHDDRFRQDARRQHRAEVEAGPARDVGEIPGAHKDRIELEQHPGRGTRVDPESDPRNRAGIRGAHDDRVVDLDPRVDLMGHLRRSDVVGGGLDRDRDDVGVQATSRRVLRESDHIEGPRGGQDRERIGVVDGVLQGAEENDRVVRRRRGIAHGGPRVHEETDFSDSRILDRADLDGDGPVLRRDGTSGRRYQRDLERLDVRKEDGDRVFGEIAVAVGGTADDRDVAAVARVRTEREGVGDVVICDRGVKNGVEYAVQTAAEPQVDGLQTQIVVGLHAEAQPAGDVLRIPRGIREGDHRRLGVGLDAANPARRLARVDSQRERADTQNCGTPSDQPHIYPLRLYRPAGLLPAGRDQIVDDVWRDQDQEITPTLCLGGEPEQLAQNRQIYKKRDSGLRYRDLGHRKSANYSRFAVIDQDLVVRLLRLERESDVHRCRPDVGALGVHFHQDLTGARHMRSDAEVDAGLLERHRCARNRLTGPTACVHGAHIDDTDWHAVTDEDLGLPVIERRDRRLGLDVGEVDALQRLHERGEVEVADRGREDQVERRIDYFLARVAERRQRVAAQRDDVLVGWEVFRRHERVGYAVEIGIDRFGGARIGTLNELIEELCRRAKVVLDAELLDVLAVDEDDLRLDRDLRRALVQTFHELHDFVDARGDLGDHERVARRVGHRVAALAENRRHRRDERGRLRVVDAHEARRDRHGRVSARQLDLTHDIQDAAGERLHGQTL